MYCLYHSPAQVEVPSCCLFSCADYLFGRSLCSPGWPGPAFQNAIQQPVNALLAGASMLNIPCLVLLKGPSAHLVGLILPSQNAVQQLVNALLAGFNVTLACADEVQQAVGLYTLACERIGVLDLDLQAHTQQIQEIDEAY